MEQALIESVSELVPQVEPTEADPLEAGQIVARKYRVGELIAVGGMGVVHAGTHLELGHTVAIKCVRADCASSGEVVRRFLNEARVAASLRSDHVAKVFDAGWTPDGVPYIVMEHLQGRDLATQLVESGALPVRDAVRYILEACDALEEAHRAGLIHRDVKPENLFIVEHSNGKTALKLLDFGVSTHFRPASGSRRMTAGGHSVGSPNYMSPEQMTSPRDTDQRTDIWSLGAVLYELLTGVRAFDGETVPMICSAVLSTEPAPISKLRPEVSPALERIVQKCLERDRERRFESVALLKEALQPYAAPDARDPASNSMTQTARRIPSEASTSESMAPVFSDLEVRTSDIPKVPVRSWFAPSALVIAGMLAVAGGLAADIAPQAVTEMLAPRLSETDPVPARWARLPAILGPSRGVVHVGPSAEGGELRAEPEKEEAETRPAPTRYQRPLTPEEIQARRERYRAWIESQGLTPISEATD